MTTGNPKAAKAESEGAGVRGIEDYRNLLGQIESKLYVLQCTYPGRTTEVELTKIRAFIFEAMGFEVKITGTSKTGLSMKNPKPKRKVQP